MTTDEDMATEHEDDAAADAMTLTEHLAELRRAAEALAHPAVLERLEEHLRAMYAASPPESVHALDLEELRATDVTFYTAWDGDELLGPAETAARAPGQDPRHVRHRRQQ